MNSQKTDLDLGAGGSVQTGFHVDGPELPLIIRPTDPTTDPITWAKEWKAWVQANLTRFGALLFRGFNFNGVVGFDQIVKVLSGGSLPYMERSSPRDSVYGNIYTSTSHRASEAIFLHNEQSYNLNFPQHIYFYCVNPADEFGATPIADTRRVYASLPQEIVERFVQGGYRYTRNFGDGYGVPWETAFQTADPTALEKYCAENQIQVTWKDSQRLRTNQTRPVVARHPISGELTWFNHLLFFHVTSLNPDICAFMREEFAEDELPNNTFYSDGSSIENEVLETIRAAYEDHKVSIPWEKGDMLMLDNMLVAHGRQPFKGARKVVVAMSNSVAWADVRFDGS